MRILVGTPVHQVKDYSMERWLANVAELQKEHPTDLFMVDNSPSIEYVEKVKGYCAKYGVKNYKIEYLELPPEQEVFERVARSREVIRQYVLAHDYDAWFSWECDQIIPTNALDILIKMMKAGDFMMVHHNGWLRENPTLYLAEFGVSLIRRDCLEKFGFLLQLGPGPDSTDTLELNEKVSVEQALKETDKYIDIYGIIDPEKWFKKRVLRDGGNYIDVYGAINPIYHLNQ